MTTQFEKIKYFRRYRKTYKFFAPFKKNPRYFFIFWAYLVFVHFLGFIINSSVHDHSIKNIFILSFGPIFTSLFFSIIDVNKKRLFETATIILFQFCVASTIFFLIEFGFTIKTILLNENLHFRRNLDSSVYFASVFMICFPLLFYHRRRLTLLRKIVGITLILSGFLFFSWLPHSDGFFREVAWKTQLLIGAPIARRLGDDADIEPYYEIDRLWEAQPSLLQLSSEKFEKRTTGQQNVYAIAVAADGTQKIFGREAEAALANFSVLFGSSYKGGALLSNAARHRLTAPIATRSHVDILAKAMGNQIDPDNDVAVVFLTSHGSETADLQTELSYIELQALNSKTLAASLAASRIKKRVIIVSACYAGSWIPALANDDTIIIAAAAANRTSFGCDDRRQLTYFGEAFLKRSLNTERSLQKAFESTKDMIAKWELGMLSIPSNPTVSVGKNMTEFWTKDWSRE